jgi:hypothetical protein
VAQQALATYQGTGTKTPHELLLGTKPDMGGVRVYGLPAYALRPALRIRKMSDRPKAGRYLGVGSTVALFLPRGADNCVERCDIHVVKPSKLLFQSVGMDGISKRIPIFSIEWRCFLIFGIQRHVRDQWRTS